mmetsp:Transcript_185/g.329  ORF Transcript_185/g.329 Transcript_185/m.329 type:complete len:81 (-) Transcript_185:1512-1754(-)
MVLILAAFAAHKTKEMVEYQYLFITEPVEKNHFSSDYIFNQEDSDWNIAFGVIAFDVDSSDVDSSSKDPLDDSYGRLVAF